jgi:hypothetical protein
MRRLILFAGFGTALAGLVVAVEQALQWQHYRVWPNIPFSVLWVALGGNEPPDPRSVGFVAPTIWAWFLRLPVAVVLFCAGTFTAWFGGTMVGGTRFRL